MTTIDYSDSTPDVTFTYTRLGQHCTVTDVIGIREFAYSATTLDLTSETLPPGFYGDKVLTRTHDALGRDTGFLLGPVATPSADADVLYAYDQFGRFSTLTNAKLPTPNTFAYAYLANSDLLATTTYPSDITVTRAYEFQRNLIDYTENKVGATTVSKYDYTNDAIGRRTARAQTGTAFTAADSITFGYNTRNEVTSAAAVTDPAYNFAYAYDPIGNRQTYTNDGNPATTYTTNALNQYTGISGLTNPAYDLDGNMTLMPSTAGDWTLTWDAENRLVRAEHIVGAPASSRALVFVYDYMSRRVAKLTYTSTDAGETWTLASHTKFLYDAWNLVLELDATQTPAVTLKTYTWGLDLSQSLQGAGGVGGLLAVRDAATSETYWALCDANGNVSEYLAASDSSIAAHYEYDPFGNTTVATGTHAAEFAHRFSTKFLDGETGLYYYGYRFYSPEVGRWGNRDPIEERGGLGLYGYVRNSPVNGSDALGLFAPGDRCSCSTPGIPHLTTSTTAEVSLSDKYQVRFKADHPPKNTGGGCYTEVEPLWTTCWDNDVGSVPPSGWNWFPGWDLGPRSYNPVPYPPSAGADTIVSYLKLRYLYCDPNTCTWQSKEDMVPAPACQWRGAFPWFPSTGHWDCH